MGQNDFARHLAETAQDPAGEFFEYKGTTFPKAQGPVLMRKEHDFFADKDRFMTPPEIQQLDKKLQEESRPVQVAQAYDGPPNPTNTPIGSRPQGESGAGYQFLTESASRRAYLERRAREEHQLNLEREKELKALEKVYGLPSPLSAMQQGGREATDQLLYNAETKLNDLQRALGFKNVPQDREVPPRTEEQERLRELHPRYYGLGSLMTSYFTKKAVGRVGFGRDPKGHETQLINQTMEAIKKPTEEDKKKK